MLGGQIDFAVVHRSWADMLLKESSISRVCRRGQPQRATVVSHVVS